MTRRPLRTLLLALVFLAGAPSARADDFDPRGRQRPRPSSGSRPARPAAQGGARPTAAPTTPDALIARYSAVVMSQPGDSFPLQRLAQLYRERDGKLDALVSDFEARAKSPGAEQFGATVALAGIYKLEGKTDAARATLERALALHATSPAALLALARLLQDGGETAAARQRYEEALARQTAQSDKEQTLRTLMQLALDEKRFDAAKGYQQALVKLAPTNLFVKGELARELVQRGEHARAVDEYKDFVKAAQGDNRTLAPALKDLGRAQAKAQRHGEALATLKQALQAAGSEAAVRAEIYEIVAEIHRADQKLPELIKQLEAERPTDFARLALLGSLYEETGDTSNAIAVYRRALAVNPRHIDLRLKVVRVLQAQGELDKAIEEYDKLIRAAPNNPQFVFEECEALMQRGDRARALKLLSELEARGGRDEDVLARLADFYGRIGEGERSLRVLTKLTQVATSDPGHLVDLGDRYFQDGNKALAVQTWKRILTTVSPRARALAALGDVYFEHDMTREALAAYQEAVQLDGASAAYKKQLASALERTRAYPQARELWEQLAAKAKKSGDKLLQREARTRIVTLWGFERVLERQVAPLQAKLSAAPPDVEAGRMLAEVQLHLRKLPDAEATLRTVVKLTPGDVDGYLALERVLVQRGKLRDAIAVLESLVAVDPKRARELYQRMAQYAIDLAEDEAAIRYAARAVELNPDDAEGHRRLGSMYRSKQDFTRAIAEYRAAIQKNDRLFIVYLDLADLLLARGQGKDADQLLRRVIRGAPDEELVARAARMSMQVNMGDGTLESLEQELLPLAIGNPQRKIYRRVLLDLYGTLTFALVQQARYGSSEDATRAAQSLERIGTRAIKPLLDALVDGDPGQQRVAIDVLGHVKNRNAAPSLFAFATGQGDSSLRTQAMLACGSLRDPSLLGKLTALVFPDGRDGDGAATDALSVAATWAIAKLGDKRATATLRRIVRDGTPDMRAFAILGLAEARERASIPLAAELARSLEGGAVSRAAAALALGQLGAESERATLLSLAEGSEPLARSAAIVALARIGAPKGAFPGGAVATRAVADALFAGADEEGRPRSGGGLLERAAAAALVAVRSRDAAVLGREALPSPDETLDVEALLEASVPPLPPAEAREAALVAFRGPVLEAARAALATTSSRAEAVMSALGAQHGAVAPLFDGPSPRASEAAVEAARSIHEALEADVAALASHPDVARRAQAIAILARGRSPVARAALTRAVSDPAEEVQRVALTAIGASRDGALVDAIVPVLRASPRWSVRILAARALASMRSPEAVRALAAAARSDAFAMVREAALESLVHVDRAAAIALARERATSEPEPRVRDSARAIAKLSP